MRAAVEVSAARPGRGKPLLKRDIGPYRHFSAIPVKVEFREFDAVRAIGDSDCVEFPANLIAGCVKPFCYLGYRMTFAPIPRSDLRQILAKLD